MQHKIIEGHVRLRHRDKLEERWQRLLGASDRKRLVEPDAGSADLVEIKAHGNEEERAADQNSRPAPWLIQPSKERWRRRTGRRLFYRPRCSCFIRYPRRIT